MSELDALTGLATYDALARAVREPSVAAFFDVDALRRVTDEQGHLASDAVLRKIAAWLATRGNVARVGGDEFVLLLPGRTIERATELANELVAQSTAIAGVSLSAIAFIATPEMLAQRRVAFTEAFADALYRAELASGRDSGNVSVLPR